jgi:AcrR family transcriptional regulator
VNAVRSDHHIDPHADDGADRVAAVPDGGCPRRPPGRPRDERVSRSIADAAFRQLSELGYVGVTMEGVAAEAGVSRATVYRRYRDKADLLTAVIAGATAPVRDGPSDDPRRDLVRFLTEFDSRFAESCLEVIGGLLGSRESPEAMDLHRHRVVGPRMAYGRKLLEKAVALGELDPGADLDLALEMLLGAVFTRRVSGARTGAGWAERAVAAVWKGMGPGR